MRIHMKAIRSLLAERRIFLMGGHMNSIHDTGATYKDDVIVHVQPNIALEPYSTFWAGSGRNLVSMGAFSYTHSLLPHMVKVGRYSSIALGLRVMGESHPAEWLSSSPVFYNKRLMLSTFEQDYGVVSEVQTYVQGPSSITIGNDVWIGENVTLARDITIGDGAIVATNATVTKDVEPYTVVGGTPAKVIRPRFHERTVVELMELKWWQYAPHQLAELDVRYPRDLAYRLTKLLSSGEISPFTPSVVTYDDFRSCQ